MYPLSIIYEAHTLFQSRNSAKLNEADLRGLFLSLVSLALDSPGKKALEVTGNSGGKGTLQRSYFLCTGNTPIPLLIQVLYVM